MTKFYLIRHGEPDWYINECYKFKGHGRDLVPLTDKGVNQAKEAAILLKDKHAQLIITSPYTRTMQTAAILARELDLELRVEVDLREWQPDLTYEYETYEEFTELCEEFEKYKGEYPVNEQKKWETQKALEQRVNNVFNRYKTYDEVIVVCHEKVIKTQIEDELVDHCKMIEIIR